LFLHFIWYVWWQNLNGNYMLCFCWVKRLECWKVVAFIGGVVFLVSAFLPLVSVGFLGVSLVDLYGLVGWVLGQSGVSVGLVDLPVGAAVPIVGVLLTLILYPISVVLGFVSFLRRRVAFVAGILGIICWVGAVVFIASVQSMMGMFAEALGYGAGIFVGIGGAIILLVASFLKVGGSSQQAAIQSPVLMR
jgi:hypothetical protein